MRKQKTLKASKMVAACAAPVSNPRSLVTWEVCYRYRAVGATKETLSSIIVDAQHSQQAAQVARKFLREHGEMESIDIQSVYPAVK
jgi:hypothetical protein